jgi:hypothetical protein
LPNIDAKFADQICKIVQELRFLKLENMPRNAETLVWASAISALHFDYLDKELIEQTLGVILKDWKDMRNVQLSLSELLKKTGVISKVDN